MKLRVLVVDDEPHIREELVEALEDADYDCVEAPNGEEGLSVMRADERVSIVLSDIVMPGTTGLEMIRSARSEFDNGRLLEFVVMTGHGGSKEAIEALRLGAMDFIEKPVDPDYMLHVMNRAEELLLLKEAKQHFDAGLKSQVRSKTAEIRRLLNDLRVAYAESLDCLAVAAEYKDNETGAHIRRIGKYARVLADELEWPKDRCEIIELAAPLHDVGKIGTPDEILFKPGKLDSGEMKIMKKHPEIGHSILSRSDHPVMVCAAKIALGHHERWDGTGYPRGLEKKENPIEARVTILADVYDALRSERPYKPAFDHDKALKIMLEGDGRTDPKHFDPELLGAFRERNRDFEQIFERYYDPEKEAAAVVGGP